MTNRISPRQPHRFGDRLVIHDQGNLGGSGGYSRIMYEALKTTDSPFILFMDDDIEIEPDSVLRALALSRFAKKPMLVGGQMLNLQERSHLHTHGRGHRPGELHVDVPLRTSNTTTTSRPSTRCTTARTRRCCTGASTSTSTAGGCA